jgi:hypothetical protein
MVKLDRMLRLINMGSQGVTQSIGKDTARFLGASNPG